MGVLVIVLILSVPVYLVAISTNNRVFTMLAALIMAVVAANTGSPKYLLVDLVGIGIVLFISLAAIGSNTKRP